MLARQVQLRRRQLPRSEELQVGVPQRPELGQQRLECARGVARTMAETVVRLEAKALAAREDDARTRNPVGLLAIDEMAHDVEWAEGVGPLCSSRPGVTDSPQQRVQCREGAAQDLDRALETELLRHVIKLRDYIRNRSRALVS